MVSPRHEKTCAGKLLKGENGSLAQKKKKNEADQILAKAPCDHDNRGKEQQRSPTAL